MGGEDQVRAAVDGAEELEFEDQPAPAGADKGKGKGAKPKADDDDDGFPIGDAQLRPDDPVNLQLAVLPRNDWGNSQRLLKRFGHHLIYVMNSGWFAWDGRRWCQPAGEHIARTFAQRTALAVRDEAEALRVHFRYLDGGDVARIEEARRLGLVSPNFRGPKDLLAAVVAKQVRDLAKWSVTSGNLARTSSMLVQAEPDLRRDITELDARPYLVNFPSGTLEMRPATAAGDEPSIFMRKHDPADLLTHVMAADWDRELLVDMSDGEGDSEWELTLADILPAKDQRHFLRRWFGYCFAGPADEQAMLMMSGEGSNGKSVIVELVEAAIGDYGMRLPIESLKSDDARRGADARPDLADLPGRRLAVAVEPEGGMKLDTGQIKQLTERTVLRVRQLHKPFLSFVPQHRLVLQVNERPIVRGSDRGTWRRIKNLDFKQKYVREEDLGKPENEGAKIRDDDLPKRLMKRLDVVATWLVAGWLDYAREGLREPASVKEDTEQYRADNDPVGQFLLACVEKRPGSYIAGAELYGAYKRWCEEGGMDHWSQTMFGRRVSTVLSKERSGSVRYRDVAFTPGGFR